MKIIEVIADAGHRDMISVSTNIKKSKMSGLVRKMKMAAFPDDIPAA